MYGILRGAVLALLLSSAAVTASAQQTGAAVGNLAPAVTLQTLDGRDLDLGRFIGRTPVVLHFFAAWCSQCRAQMPSLHAAVTKHGRAVKFVGVAVSANQSLERARRYARAHDMTHELVYDARGAAVEAYDVPTTSYVVVIDRRGRIVFTGSGPDLDIVTAADRGLVEQPSRER